VWIGIETRTKIDVFEEKRIIIGGFWKLTSN
jgi:hypothetical protein